MLIKEVFHNPIGISNLDDDYALDTEVCQAYFQIMLNDPEILEILHLSLAQNQKMLDSMKQMRDRAISGTVKDLLDSQIKNATLQIAEIKRRMDGQ
jgi:hypothetical protein